MIAEFCSTSITSLKSPSTFLSASCKKKMRSIPRMRPVPTKGEISRKISFSSYNQTLSFKMILLCNLSGLLPYLGVYMGKNRHARQRNTALLILRIFDTPSIIKRQVYPSTRDFLGKKIKTTCDILTST